MNCWNPNGTTRRLREVAMFSLLMAFNFIGMEEVKRHVGYVANIEIWGNYTMMNILSNIIDKCSSFFHSCQAKCRYRENNDHLSFDNLMHNHGLRTTTKKRSHRSDQAKSLDSEIKWYSDHTILSYGRHDLKSVNTYTRKSNYKWSIQEKQHSNYLSTLSSYQ